MSQNDTRRIGVNLESVKSLVSLEFRNVPGGYGFLADLKNQNNPPLLEITPQAPGKLVCLFGGPTPEMENIWAAAKMYKKIILDSCFLKNCHADILPSLYGQKKSSVLDFIGVIQTKTLSSSLRLANLVLEIPTASLIEIDSGRALGGQSLIYFTFGSKNKKAIEKSLKLYKADFVIFPKERHFTNHYFQLA